MASGPGLAYRDGSLGSVCGNGGCGGIGEYFESGVSGLGQGISVPTSLILGVGIGLGLAYFGGCKMMAKPTPNKKRRRRRRRC
jgi:hypothetical protein